MLSLTVGVGDALQHTPRAVTAIPPSSVMAPPDTAEVVVIERTAFVVSSGTMVGVEKLVSLP
jgi:hypothetical protein